MLIVRFMLTVDTSNYDLMRSGLVWSGQLQCGVECRKQENASIKLHQKEGHSTTLFVFVVCGLGVSILTPNIFVELETRTPYQKIQNKVDKVLKSTRILVVYNTYDHHHHHTSHKIMNHKGHQEGQFACLIVEQSEKKIRTQIPKHCFY